MKIDPQKLQAMFLRPQSEANQNLTKSGEYDTFAALLEEESKNQSQTTSATTSTSAALMTNSLLGLIQAGQATSATASVSAQDQVEGVLELLDQYIAALGDPQKTLKDIAPLAEDLGNQASSLDELAAGLASSDPLKQITNDTAVLAGVEALKFRRGDFV
ncbi:MAG: hypothetical protein LBE31_02465 [Deltaproteobacteria bacterium]|jgi:hypothetical protein|nr:hypothetical protein [Deltaproteobacteria bacterium]